MHDIYVGIAVIFLLSLGLFVAGLRAVRAAPARISILLALVPVVLIILYTSFARDSLHLAKVLPFSNLIVLGNPLPLAGGFLAGLAWARIPGGKWRRGITIFPLILVSLYAAYGRLIGSPPACENYWKDDVCIQTTPASCSAASAATLLRAHGLQATEAEMASLCFTRSMGTTMPGLYRGLKVKTAGTGWDVEVFFCKAEEVRSGHYAPAILKVGLDTGKSPDSRYQKEWGWTPGTSHTVVLFRFLENDEIEMGDPSVGRERWGFEPLKVLWQGEGLRLVKR